MSPSAISSNRAAKVARGRKTSAKIQMTRRPRFAPVAEHLRTVDGIVFASRREMNRYLALKMLEDIGEIRDLERQPRFEIAINGKRFCVYTADFRYVRRSGAVIIEDVKSSGTRKDTAYRLRKRAAELSYGITVVEVET